MLAFYLNNRPFLLDESSSIVIDEENPAWNFKEYNGSAGMGISIPINDVNRMLLGNPDRFEKFRKGKASEFENFRAEFSGNLLIAGTLIVQSANNGVYKCWCRSEVGNIGKEYSEKYISDSYSFWQPIQFNNKASYDPETDDYDCPKIYNPDFFSGKGRVVTIHEKITNPNYIPEDWEWDETSSVLDEETIPRGEKVEDLTAAFYKTAGWFVNDRDLSGKVKAPTTESVKALIEIVDSLQVNVVSPMLFLNRVLENIFTDAKFPIGNSFLNEDDDLKKLILYNNFDITQNTYVTTSDWWNWNKDKQNRSEFYQALGQTVLFISRNAQQPFYYKDLVPKIKLSNLLLSIQNTLNVFFFPRKHLRIMDIIDRESIFTLPSIDISEYMIGEWEPGEKVNTTLKFSFSHDSSDTYFTEGWEKIDDYRDREKEPLDTWDDLKDIEQPRMEEVRYLRKENKFVRYKLWVKHVQDLESGSELDGRYLGWGTISVGFQNGFFNYGQEDEEEIKSDFSTLLGEEICITEQKGNTSDERFEYESLSPRLLFSLGNGSAKYETDNLRLDWEYPQKGLLDKRWKNTSRFYCQRLPVKRDAELPQNVINYIKRNIWRRFRSEEGEFVIDNIRTSYGLHKIGATKINGFKVEYAPKEYDLSGPWNVGDMIEIDEGLNFDNADVWDSYPLII